LFFTWSRTWSASTDAPGLEHQVGGEALPVLVVVDADDRRLLDPLHVGEQVLDLAGVDVLAARDDHVVGAPGDEQQAVAVEVPEVAGAEHAVDLLGLRRARRVAGEQHLVAHEDAPGLAGRHLAVVVAEDLDDGAGRRAPRGAGLAAQLPGLGDRGPRDLGGAVEHVELVAEGVEELGDLRRRHRRAGGGDRGQRRDVVLGLDVVVELEDALQHHGHREHRRAAVVAIAASASSGVDLRRSTSVEPIASRSGTPRSPTCGTAARTPAPARGRRAGCARGSR
jgi:hypothetical protein